MKSVVRVNERGVRIGESHPRAKLSDADVEALIADRGPAGAPLMSLAELATAYGVSKSAAKAYIDGRLRGQIGPRKEAPPTRRLKVKKVSVRLAVPLHIRAKLHRLGGAAWLVRVVEQACARPVIGDGGSNLHVHAAK
jgi:hypothetical protein